MKVRLMKVTFYPSYSNLFFLKVTEHQHAAGLHDRRQLVPQLEAFRAVDLVDGTRGEHVRDLQGAQLVALLVHGALDESEKEAFIAFAANHNADGNSYLKKEELKAAAQGWNAQGETVEEEAADEEIEESTEAIVDEVDEGEEYHDEMDSEESEDADIESTESDNESEEEVDDEHQHTES